MPLKKQITITRTQGEWERMEKLSIQLGKPTLTALFHSELYKLEKKIDECPHCVCAASGNKLERKIYIHEDTYNRLAKIAALMQRPIGTVVDEFIITPLLLK